MTMDPDGRARGADGRSATRRTVGGRYRLDELLGRGGMGAVWAGHDERLGREVAVKEVIPPPELTDDQREELRERTMREARAAARISSSAAVTVYDVVEEDGRPWIVMQRLHARTLSEIVGDEGPLHPTRAARIGLRLLDALTAAHAAGVLHRDVKPANVMVTASDDAVLTDFGIATLEGDPSMTATGMLIGSPSYLSPERARGEPAATAADLWSLGATLYYAVEGRPPFQRQGQLGTLTAVLAEEPLPATLAGPLAPVLSRLLAKDPAARLDADGARRMLGPVARGEVDAVVLPVAAAPSAAQVRAQVEGERTRPLHVPPPVRQPPGGRAAAAEPQAASSASRGPVAAVVLVALVAVAIAAAALAGALGGNDRGAVTSDAAGASVQGSAPGDDPAASDPAQPPEASAPESTPDTPPQSSLEPPEAAEKVPESPEGFARYADESGFSVAVPQGWVVSRDGSTVQFEEPDTGRFLRVDQTEDPQDDPAQDWREQEESVSERLDGYEQVGIEPVDYRGWEAADWEFTWEPGSGRLHVLNRGFVTAEDQAYALYWSVPEGQWEDSLEEFEAIAESFQPAG